MDYLTKLMMKTIASVALIAAVTIGLLVYCLEHSIIQRWGSTLVVVNALLNMAVIAISQVVMNRHKRADNR